MRRALAILLSLSVLGLGPTAKAAPRPVLVFVTTHESTDGDIRIKFSDGSISAPIDPPSVGAEPGRVYNSSSTPTVSPDGTKIAFVGFNYACASSCYGASTIYTMNIDGTGLTPIFHPTNEGFWFVLDPAWSPDGKRIMFVSYYKKIDGQRRLPDLWVLDQEPSGAWSAPSRLIARPGAERWPEWSPDGKEVAYEYIPDADGWQTPGYDNRHTEIAVSPVDGSGSHRSLARSPFVTDAAYSPDGEWIAYADYNEKGNHDNEIRVMRRDGSDKRTIATGVRWPWSLDYSPDGRHIAFGEGWKDQHERIVQVAVASPHRLSVLVDFENSYDHMPEFFPVP